MIQRLTKILFLSQVLFLVTICVPELYSQPVEPPQGIKVLGVRVEGSVSADQGLVIANSGLIVGREVMGEDIQKSIRRIWSLNLFSHVELLLEREVSDGGFFLIKVKEYPRLDKVSVHGQKKIKKKEIEEILNLYKGQVLRPARIQKSLRDLKNEYKEKGYLLAEIETEIVDTDDEMKKELHVEIDEGKKVRIKKIYFEGNEAFKDKKLRKKLKKTKQKGIFRSGSFDRNEYETDLENIISFYRNNGYRDAEIIGDTITYSENRKRMFLTIQMNEGTSYIFGDVLFEGNTLFDDEKLLSQLAFKPGDVFSKEKLDYTSSERLGSLYYDKGYIYSRIEPTLIPIGEDTLDVHYAVHEGNQFKIRKINVIGNTKTKEKVIRREFVLYPGETFDVSKLRRSIREVTILNYFANIVPDVQQVDDDEVDLYIEVEEKPTDQANLAAGYSERDGMIGSVGFMMPNLLGNGQRFNLDWNFGRIYRSFSISFTEPWMFNTPTLGGISFFDMRRGGTYYGFDEQVTGATFRLGRRFRWPDDYTRGDWIYRIDRTSYNNFSDSFRSSNPRDLKENEPRFSSSLTNIFTRDSRDNLEFPSNGSVQSYSVELAGSIFGGNDQYVKQVFKSEWYFPVAPKLVLYSSTKYGVLTSLTDKPQDIPYIDYFFMGGSGISFGESLRGYEDRAVGPQTQIGGYAVGGKSLFKQTIEARIPVITTPTVFALGFVDAGNTWLTTGETNLNRLNRSMGFGMRLYMPFIGLIGLDYGYGFDYPALNGKRRGRWVPHFQFGRTF
ncbi:MAG: outer membrane protein assembly factor BamA [Candidatus Electryonea clarkiae]|nr:outer membrane protein assembly factor BamA [Candidatus Electryonea clarkiae]MDP8287943.1 outer membrane protein assembly factor BamA [Candidatus Electryonea clarkiae]